MFDNTLKINNLTGTLYWTIGSHEDTSPFWPLKDQKQMWPHLLAPLCWDVPTGGSGQYGQ